MDCFVGRGGALAEQAGTNALDRCKGRRALQSSVPWGGLWHARFANREEDGDAGGRAILEFNVNEVFLEATANHVGKGVRRESVE